VSLLKKGTLLPVARWECSFLSKEHSLRARLFPPQLSKIVGEGKVALPPLLFSIEGEGGLNLSLPLYCK